VGLMFVFLKWEVGEVGSWKLEKLEVGSGKWEAPSNAMLRDRVKLPTSNSQPLIQLPLSHTSQAKQLIHFTEVHLKGIVLSEQPVDRAGEWCHV